MESVKITEISLFQVSAPRPETGSSNRTRQSHALDLYGARESAAPRAGPAEIRGIYVEILTDEGISGLFGPIDRDQAFVIHHHLEWSRRAQRLVSWVFFPELSAPCRPPKCSSSFWGWGSLWWGAS